MKWDRRAVSLPFLIQWSLEKAKLKDWSGLNWHESTEGAFPLSGRVQQATISFLVTLLVFDPLNHVTEVGVASK